MKCAQLTRRRVLQAHLLQSCIGASTGFLCCQLRKSGSRPTFSPSRKQQTVQMGAVRPLTLVLLGDVMLGRQETVTSFCYQSCSAPCARMLAWHTLNHCPSAADPAGDPCLGILKPWVSNMCYCLHHNAGWWMTASPVMLCARRQHSAMCCPFFKAWTQPPPLSQAT